MQGIQKGTISSLENGNIARILPNMSDGMVTRPLVIPWWMRGEMGNLSPGDEVVYAVFEDGTGIVLARTDGEWSGIVPQDIVIKGISFASHTHTGHYGETSTPH